MQVKKEKKSQWNMKRNSFLKRTPLKRKGNPLKQGKGLKSGGRIKVNGHNTLRPKPKTEEEKRANQEKWEKDKEFYQHIWDTRPHICSSCNNPIYGELRTTYIEHVLEKGNDRFAHLRYCEDNIRVICQDCHSLKSNGFPTEKYQEIIDETLKKFNNNELCVKEQ